ncbi:MAG: serine protease [Bacteroidetes bacterium]|nr:serine protease [Bacteroidota bacterium]
MKQFFIYLFLIFSFSSSLQAKFQSGLIEKVKNSVFPVILTSDTQNGLYKKTDHFDESGYATNPMIPGPDPVDDYVYHGSTGFIFQYEGENYVITSYEGKFFSPDYQVNAIIDYHLYQLELVGADRFYDISVLKFSDSELSASLTPLCLSALPPSYLERPVFTVAAPPNYVSHYISPGKMATLTSETELFTHRQGYIIHYSRLIAGCAGSPIIDELGEVVGLNTQFLLKGKKPAVVALDSYTLRDQLKRILVNHGKIPRSFLGIEFRQGVVGENGNSEFPMIAGIVSGGPSEKILRNKINHYITHVNGQSVNNLQQLWSMLELLPPDNPVSLRLVKDARGFGIDTVIFKAERLNSESFCKIGSYYLDTQTTGNTHTSSHASKAVHIPTAELEQLGKTVKLMAWGNVVSKLDLSQMTKNNANISQRNHLESMNSLYY